ncbi:MAG TPA: sulfonate ABC transporter substrate-binding protein [Paraburkholderia sp.]|jgi:sulfonate transport system substrate-binding protein|nr:sulfonate ABC transporter substrate-binding protein [Paraburkholderia sp.]
MIPFPRNAWRRTFALAAIVALASAAAHAEPAASHTVRIGYQKAGLLAILKAQGTLEHALAPLGYDVKWFEFPAGPQLLEALNAKSIDFGYTGAPPPVFAQAAGVQFVYVGAEPGSPHNEALIVKSDSPIRTATDLRGKRVALQKGSSSNYLLLQILSKARLGFQDIHPVYLAPADARAAFENGDVDAWVIWDPYYAAAQQTLHARTVADYTSLDASYNFYEATPEFARRQPAAVNVVLAQLRAGGRWVNEHPAETAALLAPKVGLDTTLVETWVRRVPYGTLPVTEDVLRSQQKVADAFYGAKLIPQKINVRELAWQRTANTADLARK